MGTKYLPTKKDLKAADRYRNINHPLPHQRKSTTTLPKKKGASEAVAMDNQQPKNGASQGAAR